MESLAASERQTKKTGLQEKFHAALNQNQINDTPQK